MKKPIAQCDEYETASARQLLCTIARGFREFVTMTGAKNFTYDAENERGSLEFSINPRYMANKAARVEIRCTYADLISIFFYTRKGKLIDSMEGFFGEDVLPTFREKTALATIMPRCINVIEVYA